MTSDGTKSKPGIDAENETYQPKPEERAAAQRILKRREAHPPAPRFKVTHADSKVSLTADHIDEVVGNLLLTDSVATGSTTFSGGLLEQMANAARSGKKLTAGELNFMLAVVHEIGPRDPLEALLATQMAAIHNATMVAVRRLNHCETITQQDSASNMLNKLARTFAAQVEALKRYRSTGEQNIKVQHVTVNEGGQAIVGNVQAGGGGAQKNESQSHAPSSTDERGPPLLSHEQTLGMPLPFASREGATSMSDARRKSGSTER